MQVDLFLPPDDHPLNSIVHSIFQARDAGPTYRHETILPKGNVDVLFNLGDRMQVLGAGSTSVLPSAKIQLAGVQTAGFASRPDGNTHLVGISLRMEHASSVLPIAQNEITDRRIEADCVLSDTADLFDKLAEAPDFRIRRRLLLDWISTRVRIGERHRLIAHACRVLREQPTETRVAEVARDAGLSPRHFQRVFTQAVGITPSRYVRMKRFVRALHLIPRLPTLTAVAHAAWYTDQAHFCRDFKEFAGMTPDAYRRGAGRVTGHVLIETANVSDSYKAAGGRFGIIAGQEAPNDDRTSAHSTVAAPVPRAPGRASR